MVTHVLMQLQAEAVEQMLSIRRAVEDQQPIDPEWVSSLRAASAKFAKSAEVYEAWRKKQYEGGS